MKWVANKTFPHPVLSSGSPASERDYVGREFQMNPDLQLLEDTSVQLQLEFALSEQSLLRLIEKNKAKYAAEVHCRRTYVRRLVSSKENKFSTTFQKGELHERVEISPYIVCTDNVKGHFSKTLHKEFGKTRFDFSPGAVLAIAHPFSYWVEPGVVKKWGSIFVLDQSDRIQKGAFDFDLEDEKIRILMHHDDAKVFRSWQDSGRMFPSLLASVFLTTITETLRIMASEQDAYDDKKWFHVIQHKLDEQNLVLKDDSPCFQFAQKLLMFPVGKMLDRGDE